MADRTGRRVRRGGSWNVNPGVFRSASRYWATAHSWGDGGGFRVAGTLR